MIDFEISQDELAKAVRQMTKARTLGEHELVDLACYRDNIKFVVTGCEFTCRATVELKGMARMPLAILPKLRKAATTFGDKPLRIRIEAGRIRVNSMSIALDGITTQKMSDRPIDIPDDASVRDILALKYVFTKEEVAESDLTARFTTRILPSRHRGRLGTRRASLLVHRAATGKRGLRQNYAIVSDLDALVEQIAHRGLDPATRENYPNGVRKITYRDADGNEIGFGGGPN